MEIYGDSGYILAKNNTDLVLRNNVYKEEKLSKVTEKDIHVYTDPFSFLADLLRGKIKLEDHGLYSLENNMIVVRILEAARLSAKTGKEVKF